MKAILALVATSAAVALNDAPPYFNEPAWRQTYPSAAGLVQTEAMTACQRFGTVGVTCGPSDSQLFAVGMEGNEHLNQDITIRNEKFSYSQSLAQLSQAPFPQYESQEPEKVLIPQTTWARHHTTYY